MGNRLAHAISPYLLQHADQPVDWHEWGSEALDLARHADRPILLSVGYAACHWCHVMAHETFDDGGVADLLAESVVSVKVDREERPDVDAVYMDVAVAMTGRGGWPLTCLLTPDGLPFFAATYLPKASFVQVIEQVSRAWRDHRAEVVAGAERVADAMRRGATAGTTRGWSPGGESEAALSEHTLAEAVDVLARRHDDVRGGFGGAPKFPPSPVLGFLVRHHARTGDERALTMLATTGRAMARSGLYDQLAGGFARYAVDADWVVPHFEKMLADNAQLLDVYARWYAGTGDPLAGRVASETADFLLRDLRTDEGGFASSLDADTGGVEGATYVWTPQQITDVVGTDDGPRVCALLGVTSAGTFEHGTSTLRLVGDDDLTDPLWWGPTRERLASARRRRPQPARDDKVVTSWNGLAIGALATASQALERPELATAAADAARYLLDHHRQDSRLVRASRGGRVGPAQGCADDYGNLARGLVMLARADADPAWLGPATEMLTSASTVLDAGDGGFFDTPDSNGELFVRPRATSDNTEPCGQSALAGAGAALGAWTADEAVLGRAHGAVAACRAVAVGDPRMAGWTLAVAEELLRPEPSPFVCEGGVCRVPTPARAAD